MNTQPPSTQQWTIRQLPWFVILLALFIFGGFGWAFFAKDKPLLIFAAFGGFFAVLAFFAEVITCQLDRQKQSITIKQSRLWGTKRHRIDFANIHTISVHKSSDSDGGYTYRLLFTLHNGNSVPLANNSSSGQQSKARLAQKIAAYINQSGSFHVLTALDGIVRIHHDGETDGTRWQITFVRDNDNLPHTIWETRTVTFSPGFLFLVPAYSPFKGATPGGLAGKLVQKLYQQYNLGVLDVKPNDLPDFKDTQILPGEEASLRGFTLVSPNPGLARSWLTPYRIQQLTAWQASNSISPNKAASDPYILISTQGLRVAFRGHFSQAHEIHQIASLGTALAKNG